MQKYGVNELRKMFLDFMESKGHLIMKSFSLVPQNDKSILLINAGMTPLKPYFTGAEIPPRKRVATCQKCIRTGDIENVGKTARHGTFFEMLGNFSFGDYFKKEAIAWSWEFLTEVVGLEADRLYPSVYLDDDEAFNIWRDEVGIAPERIFRFGKEDNFWEHGSGPCGPCSEIYYDRGEEYGCGKPGCTVGCDCDRYMEIWNNVFTQFDNDGNGNYTELATKNIDTGMGLERLAVVVQGVDSIFDVDTIQALRSRVCEVCGCEYHKVHDIDVSVRLITDHIRSATFMISDGIMPTNEGRGYVLRRIIRRAARHGRILGKKERFLADLSRTVIEGSKDGYPELEEKKEFIFKVLDSEEKQFNKTIDQGLAILSSMEDELKAAGKTVLDGRDAFKLHDTYGFPLDLTKEILEEKGYSVDEEGFAQAMEEQKTRGRENASFSHKYSGGDETVYDQIDTSLTTDFVGYEMTSCDSVITAMTTETELADSLMEGQNGTIITKVTPFYATMGGQTGDTGIIRTDNGEFEVEDTIKLLGGRVGHVGRMVSGILSVGDTVKMAVDENRRNAICRNHSATHLLQAALRKVLGTHVEQKGSLVEEGRLRFDFSHFQAMTDEEIAKTEEIVNELIREKLSVVTTQTSIAEAKKMGAMALFDEKYGDTVRVVNMGDRSIELCGGTHVKNTGDIFCFRIVSESGIAAGVRRIEAITNTGVIDYLSEKEKTLEEASELVRSKADELPEKLRHLLAELKDLRSENEALKAKIANASAGDALDNVQEVKGVKLLAVQLPDLDMNALRQLGDQFREKLGEGVVVLASDKGGKVSLCAMATESAVQKGAHAGNIIKQVAAITGGGGGGKANFASAGGKDASRIPECIAAAKDILAEMIKE